MKQEQLPPDNLPKSALDLLKKVSQEFDSLKEEKTQALYGPTRDVHRYIELLKMRTQLIANLPNKLSELKERDIEVSKDIEEKVLTFSEVAKKVFKSGSASLMNNLLIPRGSRKGDKNELELLIDDLESSRTGK